MESPPPGIEPTSLLSPVLAGGFLERQVGKIELRTGKELLKNTFDILCLTASHPNSCGLVPSRFSSVQFSSSVVSDSLQPHGLPERPSGPWKHRAPEVARAGLGGQWGRCGRNGVLLSRYTVGPRGRPQNSIT